MWVSLAGLCLKVSLGQLPDNRTSNPKKLYGRFPDRLYPIHLTRCSDATRKRS